MLLLRQHWVWAWCVWWVRSESLADHVTCISEGPVNPSAARQASIGSFLARSPTSRRRLHLSTLLRWACVCVCVWERRETPFVSQTLWGVVYSVFIWVAPFPLIFLSLQHLLFISQLHYLSVSTLSLSFPLFQSLHAENQTAYGFWVNYHYNCCLFLIGLGSEQPSNSKYIIIYIWFKDS